MKFHALAQTHLQGAVVTPVPLGRQAWHQLPVLVQVHEVLKDIMHNGDEVIAMAIDDAQLAAWRWELRAQAMEAPRQGEAQEDDTTNVARLYGPSSLSAPHTLC